MEEATLHQGFGHIRVRQVGRRLLGGPVNGNVVRAYSRKAGEQTSLIKDGVT